MQPDVNMTAAGNSSARARQAAKPSDPGTEEMAKMLGSLTLATEKSSADYLVRCWLVAEHQEHRRKIDYSRTFGEAAIGKEPKTDEDWHEVLLKFYGEEQLEYLCGDSRAVQAGIDGCPAEMAASPRWNRIFDWLQRSEAGFLQFAPMVQWAEVAFDTSLRHRNLAYCVAIGVGFEYAAIVAADKIGVYSVYCAHIANTGAKYVNNTLLDAHKTAIDKEGFAKVKRECFQDGICAYERSTLSFGECPDCGFVSGDHVLLCWPNTNTDHGFYDRFGIYKMPDCFTSDGHDPITGALKPLHYSFEAPIGAVRQMCLVFPFLLFVTSTDQFNRIDFARTADKFQCVYDDLCTEKLKHVGSRRDADLIVIMDIEKNAITRVIPVMEGIVSHLSTFPRMTCPSDVYIPRSKWRIMWNIINESKLDEHGWTWFDSFFADPTAATGNLLKGLFWRPTEDELAECEAGVAVPNKSGSVEHAKAIHLYPGGHVVHISENNISTFVERNGALYPKKKCYHGRDIKTLDSIVYGGLLVSLTPAGDIQFSSLRVIASDMKPAFIFAEKDLEKALDRKLPLKGVERAAESTTSVIGPFKAIWTSSSYHFVIQLCTGTLVAMRPRTLVELREYLEAKARLEASDIRRRMARVTTEKQLKDAHAIGVEPAGAALARADANARTAAAKTPETKV